MAMLLFFFFFFFVSPSGINGVLESSVSRRRPLSNSQVCETGRMDSFLMGCELKSGF